MSHIASTEPAAILVTGRRSIADLLWVANTSHGSGAHWFARPHVGDPDHDHLESPADAVRYLVDHHVSVPPGTPTTAQLASLATIRDAARGLAEGRLAGLEAGVARLLSRSRFELTPGGTLAADGSGWDPFVSDLLVALVQLAAIRSRLSACANPACRLLFLDDSKSHTRRWCDDGGCGNRARARGYRERQTHGGIRPTA